MAPYLQPVNVLITDDHRLITEGIARLIEGEKIISKIYTASNGREAVDKVLQEDVDCVIMDINMPVLNGLEATRLIKQQKPFVRIIVLSMICDAAIVSKMMKAGADAFLNKDTGKAELLQAITIVMQGEKFISSNISVNLFSNIKDRNIKPVEGEKQLTIREKEILHHIAEGFTNAEIAAKLYLSVATVDTHRKNILSKLQLKNTAALIKYAAENNLL